MRMAPPGSMTPSGGKPRTPKRPRANPTPKTPLPRPVRGTPKPRPTPKPRDPLSVISPTSPAVVASPTTASVRSGRPGTAPVSRPRPDIVQGPPKNPVELPGDPRGLGTVTAVPMAKGGMAKKKGYNKGGMVKSTGQMNTGIRKCGE